MLSRRHALSVVAAPVLRSHQRSGRIFADAEVYEHFMGRWSRLRTPPFVDFAGVPDSGAVPDVGSGTGSLAASIASRRARCTVTGIDPSEEYVAFGRARNHFGDRVKFEVGDAQRMLRTFRDAAGKNDDRRMPLCRAGDLESLCSQNGLEKVTERPIDITMRFDSLADYWAPFLPGQGPAGVWLRSADSGRREAVRSEVKRRLALSADDVPFSLMARAWAVRGIVPTRG